MPWGAVLGYYWFIFFLSGQSLSVPQTVPSVDLGVHSVLYGGLGWLWVRAVWYSWPTKQAGTNVVASAMVFTMLCGLSDEWNQVYVPARTADIRDVIADTLGGTLGGWGYVVWSRSRVRLKFKFGR